MTDQNQTECQKRSTEINLLYQDSLENIRYAKRQQWQLFYFSVLLQAAIIGFVSVIFEEVDLDKFQELRSLEIWFFSVVSVAVCVASLVLIGDLQRFMVHQRRKLHKIREEFFDAFYKKYSLSKSSHLSIWHGGSVLFIGGISSIGSCILTLWFVTNYIDFIIISFFFLLFAFAIIMDIQEGEGHSTPYYSD
jgi:hypothetical protein